MEALVSVIIPTLNEGEHLQKTLEKIKANRYPKEIIIVDAGSKDKTLEIAKSQNCKILKSSWKSRAVQMNLGAQQSKGKYFFFLHADTLLPKNALEQIAKTFSQSEFSQNVKKKQIVGGCFKRKFRSSSVLLKVLIKIAPLRVRFFGIIFGDQGIFVRREIFERIGKFSERVPYEDMDLSLRLKKEGKLKVLSPTLMSSARRFEKEGTFKRASLDLKTWFRYWKNNRNK